MIATLNRLDVTRLAADYSAAIRDTLTDGQLLNIRNGDNVAADYIDTAELMIEAAQLQHPGSIDITGLQADFVAAECRAADSGYRLSRVLVACEFSGTVRDAFAAAGHAAESCDILASESPGGIHHQRDVREILGDGYHIAIMHPPCTYLAACQLWRCLPKHAAKHPGRAAKKAEALEFVRDLMAMAPDRWALENPKGAIGTEIRPADDMVQPYEFGHDHSKQTMLWLHNLPKLERDPADFVEGRDAIDNNGRPCKRWANQCDGSGADRTGPSADRGHKRSRFFSGIARRMAEQWGGIIAKPAPANVTPINAGEQLALSF